MRRRHRWLVGAAVLLFAAGWLAWTMMTVESDLGPGGRAPVTESAG